MHPIDRLLRTPAALIASAAQRGLPLPTTLQALSSKAEREDARQVFLQVIDAWGEVRRIQAFFAAAEDEARRLEPDERDRALERIALARNLIGDQGALDALFDWSSPDKQQLNAGTVAR